MEPLEEEAQQRQKRWRVSSKEMEMARRLEAAHMGEKEMGERKHRRSQTAALNTMCHQLWTGYRELSNTVVIAEFSSPNAATLAALNMWRDLSAGTCATIPDDYKN
ncbi:hypothetical protein OIU79_017618 [Salix purpurea]|uniref:Uncharacterized protein n=1 Tax=Salix purpurea TaxID=77065 RepID=A0A9Q0WXY8_SALPP|nr:hypothetical protein OIU79_017618 [Salix purpurea]